MDVSRINMITPKQIDWRKLTAKDIIKHDAEGMEIPSQYLQWARAFRVDLEKNDTDETTYEMAVAKKSQPSPKELEKKAVEEKLKKEEEEKKKNNVKKKDNSVNNVSNTQTNDAEAVNNTSEDAENNDKVTNPEQKPVEEMTAQEKLKYLKDNGESTISIGKTFKQDSEDKADLSDAGTNTVSQINEQSNSDIETVESFIQEILADAQNLQSRIEAEKNKKSNSNIQKLQEELRRSGENSQTLLLQYEALFDGYEGSINEFSAVAEDTVSFGDVTVDLGKQIKSNFWHYAIGRSVENAGKNAISSGNNLNDTVVPALDTNSGNKRTVTGYQNEVANLTGVSSEQVKPKEQTENSAKEDDKNKQSNIASEKNKVDNSENLVSNNAKNKDLLAAKDEKSVETDDKKTEVEKKEEKIASGNLDEILKRKMRRGEIQEAG